MLFSKKAICIAALSTLATVCSAGSAHAITFQLDRGLNGPNGATNQGAFSDFYQDPNTTTIDFNNGTAPTSGFATYSFANNNGPSSVTSDMWAPAGQNGQNNNSKYLEVFTGDPVTITLQKTLNAFGIDWGAISADNTFSFYNNTTLVGQFTSADVEASAEKYGVLNQAQNQWNGYLNFYSQSANDNFNKIVISQASAAGGGFESDNHSFHVGTGAYVPKATPEPGVSLGLLAVGGGMFFRKRNKQKSLA